MGELTKEKMVSKETNVIPIQRFRSVVYVERMLGDSCHEQEPIVP